MTPTDPPSKLNALAFLIGRWSIRGRTEGASEDDVFGISEILWSPDRAFLEQRSVFRLGTDEVHALEIVGCRPDSDVFPAWVFSSGAPEPLSYSWQWDGRELVHAGLGSTFRGTVSPDGRVIRGAWRSDGTSSHVGANYSVEMTRFD
jgi:hypothetical protein